MSNEGNDGRDQRVTEHQREKSPDGTDDLPPAAHPPAKKGEPKPLDEMEVPALTEPEETEGG
jgi:hypothetical protein